MCAGYLDVSRRVRGVPRQGAVLFRAHVVFELASVPEMMCAILRIQYLAVCLCLYFVFFWWTVAKSKHGRTPTLPGGRACMHVGEAPQYLSTAKNSDFVDSVRAWP